MTRTPSGQDLRGVFAAVITPVEPDGTADLPRFLHHAAWALANGCDGLNVLGTTGEATSFPVSERKRVMAACTDLDPARLMVGTGCPDLASTLVLTRHAHELGFAAALVLPPYYYKGVTDNGLFAYFEALVRATEPTPIPLYLYNFPQMTGLTFSPALVRKLVEAFPGRIQGAKDSSGDMDYAADLARIDGFAVFPSTEVALASAHVDRFAGCISATVNLTAPDAAALWRTQGDATLLDAVRTRRAAISTAPLVPAVKHLVAELHGDPAFARVLPPLAPLGAADKRALADAGATAT